MSHLSQIPEFWKRLKMIIFYSTFKTFLALPYDLHFSIISCVRFVNSTMSKTSSFLHIYSEKATVFQMWVWANYNLISITQVFWKQIYHFTKIKSFRKAVLCTKELAHCFTALSICLTKFMQCVYECIKTQKFILSFKNDFDRLLRKKVAKSLQ